MELPLSELFPVNMEQGFAPAVFGVKQGWQQSEADTMCKHGCRSATTTTSALLAFRGIRRFTAPVNVTVTQLTEQLIASYARVGGINHLDGKNLPSKRIIADITQDLLRLLFPGFFD